MYLRNSLCLFKNYPIIIIVINFTKIIERLSQTLFVVFQNDPKWSNLTIHGSSSLVSTSSWPFLHTFAYDITWGKIDRLAKSTEINARIIFFKIFKDEWSENFASCLLYRLVTVSLEPLVANLLSNSIFICCRYSISFTIFFFSSF